MTAFTCCPLPLTPIDPDDEAVTDHCVSHEHRTSAVRTAGWEVAGAAPGKMSRAGSVDADMVVDVDLLYRQHLTDTDRRLIADIGGDGVGLSRALENPALETAVFGSEPPEGGLLATSPFLTFATAVHRTAARLDTATYVEERWAPRRRVPVFDVGPLRDLLAAPSSRLFLVELLASYTHVASGATWQRTPRGWRRRRFSELDPVRLADLLEAVEPSERPGIYRRLGDLALFLTGVFPDHRAVFDVGESSAARLLRLSGLEPRRDEALTGPDLLEYLGSRWYSLVARSVRALGSPETGGLAVVREMGERFREARRVLNVVTDWYLFPLRERWFGLS